MESLLGASLWLPCEEEAHLCNWALACRWQCYPRSGITTTAGCWWDKQTIVKSQTYRNTVRLLEWSSKRYTFYTTTKTAPWLIRWTLHTLASIILTQKTQVFKNLETVFKGCSIRKVENQSLVDFNQWQETVLFTINRFTSLQENT